jgi:hypothetical protein
MRVSHPALNYYQPIAPARPPTRTAADVVIYGATSAGVIAAVQLAQVGRSVALLEFGGHMGGVTASGLGATDLGNKRAIGGLARDFYRRLGRHYGREESWTFEPKVAEATFAALLADAGVTVHFHQRLADITQAGGTIRELRTESGDVWAAKMFIDASYEGDLLAAAGVSYHVGREGNARYGEIHNGVAWGHPGHNFKLAVDPYVVPGRPESGLLPGVFPGDGGQEGEGDRRVQAYNFRLCLTQAADRVPFPQPAGYDPQRYEVLRRYLEAGIWDVLRLTTAMPNGKTDTNNFGAFSSDNIGMNHAWPEADYATREKIFQDHVTYHQGLMWFLANDPRVPARVREEVGAWGLPRDEFTTTGHWPHQLYVREARRMVSDYVMTENDCVRARACADPVGLAAYTMDSHACNRVVRGGRVYNEGLVEMGGFPPYGISYRSLVPRRGECPNLLVPVCLAASHIAYGSIRMEPVFMVLAQSAALAAHLALEAGAAVQDVPYATLRDRLLAAGQVLEWRHDPFAPPEAKNP